MTTTVQVTRSFSIDAPIIFDECDRIMKRLLDLEERDPTVRDAAVAADAETGVVKVTVTAGGSDEYTARINALTRIYEGIERPRHGKANP